jgi:hypothetical protein
MRRLRDWFGLGSSFIASGLKIDFTFSLPKMHLLYVSMSSYFEYESYFTIINHNMASPVKAECRYRGAKNDD